MKRLFTFALLVFTITGLVFSVIQSEPAFAKRLTYYLGQWSSSTDKTFTVSTTGSDTTAIFELMENMSFLALVSQRDTDTSIWVKLQLLPYDYADSNGYVVDYDSARVISDGVQLLNFTNFDTDSSRVKTPPNYYGRLIFKGVTGNDTTDVKIRYESATEGDF
ncbi:MAG: hypothetical protein AVO39_10225 [delta proteobacterium MLS_D]|nr:MAG: hypothetical protein AVO39_10225 [delta proteobacterium MLS_D]